MSESPATGVSPGPASTTPNGGPNPMRRKKPQANLFMAKKGTSRPYQRQGTPSNATSASSKPPLAKAAVTKRSTPAVPDPDDDPKNFTEHRLVCTKKDILQNYRFHAMRLLSRQRANPFDPNQFERPLRLHRRFVRDKKMELQPEAPGLDDKEREKEEIRMAELQAIKEANQAQIAPTQKTAPGSAKKKPVTKQKAEDVYYSNTPEEDKRRKLRYDEARPWHLEDFDGNNTWVGSYEEPLSETYAMFVLEEAGFRVVPVEKWYKFAPTGRFEPKDYDFVERWMNKKTHGAAALIQRRQEAEQVRLQKVQERRNQDRQVGPRPLKDEEDELFRLDGDDPENLDFKDDEEFQDDDEGELLGVGDDVQESKDRIKKEMLGANIFKDLKEEKDWDAEDAKAKANKQKRRREEKKLRKALMKREKKFEYETDRSDTDGPVESSDSESDEDTDAEKQKENGELTIDDPDNKEFAPGKLSNGDPTTGTSSVASNTPGGRTEKRAGPRNLQGTSSTSSLKRPGSPNLSDVSGSESSRKRQKASRPDGSNGVRPSTCKSFPLFPFPFYLPYNVVTPTR